MPILCENNKTVSKKKKKYTNYVFMSKINYLSIGLLQKHRLFIVRFIVEFKPLYFDKQNLINV